MINDKLKEVLKSSIIIDSPDELATEDCNEKARGEIIEITKDKVNLQNAGGLISKAALLSMQGLSASEVAKELGISTVQLRKIKEAEDYRGVMDTMTRTIVETSKDYIKAASIKATMTLIESMDSNSDKIRLSAAQDILNRVGAKQADTLNIIAKTDSTSNMTKEQLKELIKLGNAEILGENSDEPTEDSKG